MITAAQLQEQLEQNGPGYTWEVENLIEAKAFGITVRTSGTSAFFTVAKVSLTMPSSIEYIVGKVRGYADLSLLDLLRQVMSDDERSEERG